MCGGARAQKHTITMNNSRQGIIGFLVSDRAPRGVYKGGVVSREGLKKNPFACEARLFVMLLFLRKIADSGKDRGFWKISSLLLSREWCRCGVSVVIVDFDTGAEGDYLAHVTFFARAKRVRKVTRAKNLLTHQFRTVFYTTRAE